MARRTQKAPEPAEVDADHPRLATTLFGQASQEARFLEAFNAGRLHHAWLLTGLRGVGKATFAYRAARFLLSQTGGSAEAGLFGAPAPPESLDVSPSAPVSQRVAAGSHADLFTAEPEKAGRQISAESARSLLQSFQLTAGEGAWRAAIVDAADDLHRSAANILLKLIEEPPPRTVLFLVSHSPGRLLPTIRSRCVQLPFDALVGDDIARILKSRRPEADTEAIAEAIRIAGGSAGRALALLDGGGAAVPEALNDALTARQGEGLLKAEAFAASVARDAFHLQIAGETLVAWLGAAARPEGTPHPAGLTDALSATAREAARLGPKPWLDLYAHAGHRLDRMRAVNLDPTQTLVDILARIQALLARA